MTAFRINRGGGGDKQKTIGILITLCYKQIMIRIAASCACVVVGLFLLPGCREVKPPATEPTPVTDQGPVVKVGSDIGEAARLMEPYGESRPMLAMATLDPEMKIKQWPIDRGVLIVVYNESTRQIVEITFHLSDERPKAERRVFEYEVLHFNPRNGRLLLATKPPEE